MVQNLWRVQFQGGDCPPPELLRGGTKNFSGASRPIFPPPELNPVSATDDTPFIQVLKIWLLDMPYPVLGAQMWWCSTSLYCIRAW